MKILKNQFLNGIEIIEGNVVVACHKQILHFLQCLQDLSLYNK